MTPWLPAICLAGVAAWLALRLAAEVRYARELRELVNELIEDEQSSEMVARAVVLESVRKEAREHGAIAVRGGQA